MDCWKATRVSARACALACAPRGLAVRARRVCTGLAVIAAVTSAACGSSPVARVSAQQPRPSPAGQQETTPGDRLWERKVGDVYENKGIARVERLGSTWALTVMCNGEHTTYLEPTDVDPAAFAQGYVQARYRYVDRTVTPRCAQAPCLPVTERRVALERLTRLAATADDARRSADRCDLQ